MLTVYTALQKEFSEDKVALDSNAAEINQKQWAQMLSLLHW